MGGGSRSYDLAGDILDRIVELVLVQPTQMFDARCRLWSWIFLCASFPQPTSPLSIARAGARNEHDQGEDCEEGDKEKVSSWGHGQTT